MLLAILLPLLTTASIAGITYWFSIASPRSEDVAGNTKTGAVIGAIIGIAILIGCFCGSYKTYLDIKTFYDATVEQYRGAITMYEGKSHASIDVEKAVRASFTDFEYQGYQGEMASMIRDLRAKLVNYNSVYMKKKLLDNVMFDWVVWEPDEDMKILNIIE